VQLAPPPASDVSGSGGKAYGAAAAAELVVDGRCRNALGGQRRDGGSDLRLMIQAASPPTQQVD